MTWLREILKIYLEEQLLIKYYVIKHLILLKIQNKMDIKKVWLQWFISFSIKNLKVVLLKMKQCKIENSLKNYTNKLLENLKNEKYIHLL